jgi:hypothetical protein
VPTALLEMVGTRSGAHSRDPVALPTVYQRHCERSEAIQLLRSDHESWIASSQGLLAMTLWSSDSNFKEQIRIEKGACPHYRGAMRPSFASIDTLDKKRAQGRPGARCTRGLACKCT